MNAGLRKGPGQFYLSLRWSSRFWSGCAVMTLFAPEWQLHQHLLVNVSNERQWHLCSSHSPLGLLTGCWLILSFLMSVNSAMPDKESVSSWYWRAHLSFCSSPWHMPKLEPEVVFHFSQKGMGVFFFFLHHLLIFPLCLAFSPRLCLFAYFEWVRLNWEER